MIGEQINKLRSVKSSGVSNNSNLFTSARCARERGKLELKSTVPFEYFGC